MDSSNESLKILKSKFRKICVNAHRAIDKRTNSHFWYKRADLDQWSREAFNRGEEFFYAEPVDINNPYGKIHLCEPKYMYKFCGPLTEEEYNEIFKQIKEDK